MLMAPVRVAHGNQVLLLIGAVRYIAQCFCCWGIDRVTSLPASLIALRLNYDRSSLAARPGRAGLASARAGYCALYRDVVILLYVYTCLDCVVCCKKTTSATGSQSTENRGMSGNSVLTGMSEGILLFVGELCFC